MRPHRPLLALAAALVFLTGAQAFAQTATRLADVNPGAASSFPRGYTRIGSDVFFSANDAANGPRLWKTDGTVAGTVVVADPDPGAPSGGLSYLIDVAGTLFFDALDGIWKSDGTAAGTVRLADVVPGPLHSDPNLVAALNGKLYFLSGRADGFESLWTSDGTPAGTVAITQLPTVYATGLRALTGRLYFLINDRLWTSDGMAVGTYELLDLTQFTPPCPEFGCFIPPDVDHYIATANGIVFVLAFENDGNSVTEVLWTTDGTVAGTTRLRAIGSASYGYEMVELNGTLYLQVEEPGTGKELWTSDGTLAGTTLLADLEPGAGSSSPSMLTVGNGLLWFVTPGPGVSHLWKSDGTADGTVELTTVPSDVTELTPLGSELFFTASAGCHGTQLWKSDGTVAPARRATAIEPGPANAFVNRLIAVNGSIVFEAFETAAGWEPWAHDGGTPPVDTCGNGVAELGEQCDLGAANGQPGSCCACGCTFVPLGEVCRASTGGCDVTEVCTGSSGTCPVDGVGACGDGLVDPGEECDLSVGNGAPGACCTCGCAFVPFGTHCRASTGPCDPYEICSGADDTCPADFSEPDGDGDGVCDPVDPCTNPGATTLALPDVKLSTNTFKGSFRGQITPPPMPAIDPLTHGLRLRVTNASGSTAIFDATIPGGVYDPVAHRGWKANKPMTSWRYGDRDKTLGVAKISVKRTKTPGALAVKVGFVGSFNLNNMGIPDPIRVTLVLDPDVPPSAQCGELAFTDAQCTPSSQGRALRCR